jgi:hypothetical protein
MVETRLLIHSLIPDSVLQSRKWQSNTLTAAATTYCYSRSRGQYNAYGKCFRPLCPLADASCVSGFRGFPRAVHQIIW